MLPRSLPESALNLPEFITAHWKRTLDGAIDRRRFELDKLDIAVASHDLSLAVEILTPLLLAEFFIIGHFSFFGKIPLLFIFLHYFLFLKFCRH